MVDEAWGFWVFSTFCGMISAFQKVFVFTNER